MSRRKVRLEEILSQYENMSYNEVYQIVRERILSGEFVPVKNAGVNGLRPSLPNAYWNVTEDEDYSELLDEMNYRLHPSINVEFYKKNPKNYAKDRDNIRRLSDYLSNHSELLKAYESMNERSFEIFGREKFLREEGGANLCRRLGISQEMLNYYDTAEPLSYYSAARFSPQNILIIENKDTFYDLRSYMKEGNSDICGITFGTLIYGAGKGIYKSFEDYVNGAEDYFNDASNGLYYFGDLDYEGIGIYEHLASQEFGDRAGGKLAIRLHTRLYELMLDKAYEMGIENMPATKEKQNTNIGEMFLGQFEESVRLKISDMLESGRYIPQEILNVHDW